MRSLLIVLICIIVIFSLENSASANNVDQDKIYAERMALYEKMEAITQVPWYYLAAIDQYERNVRNVRNDLPKPTGLIGIYFPKEVWAGALNPQEKNPITIQLFGGIGLDGNGDGLADRNDDEDVLYTFIRRVLTYGTNKDYIKLALWNYYKRDKTVGIIHNKAKMYQYFGTLKLDKHAFPVPLKANYSYRTTWGDARGWGGRRIHEGTDIFADYGVPVRATSYGVVEMKGWNRFGGWRIGIRDINNTYHYYAHLNGFANGLHVGQIVEPGMIIGSVGSTGYGPPGTSGKFPPHLHYGMYKDNGKIEWSFDPYPHLKVWERQERAEIRKAHAH